MIRKRSDEVTWEWSDACPSAALDARSHVVTSLCDAVCETHVTIKSTQDLSQWCLKIIYKVWRE